MSTARSIVAIGDMLPTRAPIANGEPAAGFAEVCDRIRGGTASVGNLDMTLTARGAPVEKLVTLRADPRLADELRKMGFDVISMANNHAMDYGDVGLSDTLEALRAAGVATVGAGLDLEAASAPATVGTRDWRVAVLAWSCLLPTGASASAGRPGVAPLHVRVSYEIDPYVQMEEPTFPPRIRSRVEDADLAAAIARIEAASSDSDFVVVLVHWGVGDSDELSEYQRPLAHAFVDAGADLVVGSHPHRIHGIERYRDKAILYSPGSVIDQVPREGLAPDVLEFMARLSPDAYVATVAVDERSSYSITISPVTQGTDGTPVVARGEAFERIAETLVRMSSKLGTSVEARAGHLVVV